jgi:hypothetical protein
MGFEPSVVLPSSIEISFLFLFLAITFVAAMINLALAGSAKAECEQSSFQCRRETLRVVQGMSIRNATQNFSKFL